MPLDRDTLAAALVGTGGAWLLGAAALHGSSDRWNRAQVKGLVFSGAGFLLSAVAAQYLQHLGPRGIAISLIGTLFAMRGMYILVRERTARRNAQTAVEKPRRPE